MILWKGMDDVGEFGDSGSGRWGTTEMIVTAAIVLTAVSVGALIFYLARRGSSTLTGSAPLELTSTPSGLETKINQIRAYLRTANKSESAAAGLTNASYALALLEDAEATYGAEALSRACDPGKLRRLIKQVQDRHGGRLAA
jgi:hypothetical protein